MAETPTLPGPDASATPSRRPHPSPALRVDLEAIRAIVSLARREGREMLIEPEARAVLAAAGIRMPPALFVRNEDEAAVADLGALRSDRLVLKVVAPELLHKADRGGVVVIPRDRTALVEAVRAMRAGVADLDVSGYSIAEFVEHDAELGNELLGSVRWTEDFGPVVSIGAGGVRAEQIAADLRPGREVAILSAWLPPAGGPQAVLEQATAVRLAALHARRAGGASFHVHLASLAARLAALGDACVPDLLAECEINPFVITDDGPMALDALVRVGHGPGRTASAPRPLDKLDRLLAPRSIGIIGVSERDNIGHIILRNLVRDGFDPNQIWIVKPGSGRIEGCCCVPSIADLPEPVDLFIVAVSAAQTPAVVDELVAREVAKSIILIPGGLGETSDSEERAAGIRRTLDAARSTPGRGPLVNGGNCMGIRSRPGRYDTFFIPSAKLAPAAGREAPLAVLAQSGGFALARLSRMSSMHPRYAITVGNQLDLTVGDYLTYLKDDPDLSVYAVYVEGFAPLDGLRFLDAAREITESGRHVVLYQAGRTSAGARAAASHTASIAGDTVVGRALAVQAGVILAHSLADFDELTRVFTLLHDRPATGRRLGAISNAGYECVAIADAVGGLELADLDEPTQEGLRALLSDAGLRGVVDVHNPLDLTPMAPDAVYETAVRAVLASDAVDIGLVGIVPFTSTLQTLPAGPDHDEDLGAPSAIAARLASIWADSRKPWVVVVDAGPRYDPLAAAIDAAGIPVFRTADAALRALDLVRRARTS